MKNLLVTTIIIMSALSNGVAQNFDLPNALKEGKLEPHVRQKITVADESKRAISVSNGIVWLKDVTFSEGTIEIDIKGTEEFQGSFPGIAFHGVDTIRFDAVYFRPFNFQSPDPVRKIHAVQYISMPEYPWNLTREKMNGVYEKAVIPTPAATDWFHAKIVVKGKEINVYVNGSSTPSLTVTKLNDRTTGRIGIMDDNKPGQFANLVIRK